MSESLELAELPNLGIKSARMLAGAGITRQSQLRDFGPVLAYLAVKQTGRRPSLNLLWAMAAGLQDRHWTDLSQGEKQALREELDELTR